MSKFKPNSELTQARLREILHYNPETGIFRWIEARPRIQVGDVAGSVQQGYIRITVDGHRFMAHTLAWLYMTGEYVARGLDHKDTNRANNRWANLRKASKSQNRMNSTVRSDSRSGHKGVHIYKSGRITAQITLPGCRARYLGTFNSIEAAAARYEEEARKHFGEYVRIK